MAEYKTLIATINANIRKNGNQEITGNILNAVLNAMVGEMGGNYQFAGVAKRDTDPGTPDQRVFYVAGESGVFPNFGGLEVPTNKVYFFTWDTAWRAVDTGILDAFVEAEAERARAEVLRATAEAQRVLNENQRIANEILRQEAESGRNARYEAAEEERDAKYTTAETERNATFNQAEAVRNAGESERITNENERKANELERKADETLRKSAESGRVSAENARVSAESGRVTAESGRVSAENARVTAESGRASAEATRVSNENSRISAENARKSAETARESAEAQRVSTFNTNEAQRAQTFTANESARQSAFEAAEAAREADYQENIVDDYQENVKGEVTHLSSRLDGVVSGNIDDCNALGEMLTSAPSEQTFVHRASPTTTDGVMKFKEIKGNSLGWNQYANLGTTKTINGITFTKNADGSMTVNGTATANVFSNDTEVPFIKGRKYIKIVNGEETDDCLVQYFYTLPSGGGAALETGTRIITAPDSRDSTIIIRVRVRSGATISNKTFSALFVDLTAMFGAGNEPSTYAEFLVRKPKVEDEFAYNEGTIINNTAKSIEVGGRNIWDEVMEKGEYNPSTGAKVDANASMRSANYIPVVGNTEYYFSKQNTSSFAVLLLWYGADKSLISTNLIRSNGATTSPSNACFLTFYITQTTENKHDICINLSDTSFNGKYESHHTASFDCDWKKVLDAEGNPLFPYGGCSAGSAHDALTPHTSEKRVGVKVFDGTENWGVIKASAAVAGKEGWLIISPIIQGMKSMAECYASHYIFKNNYWYQTNIGEMSHQSDQSNICILEAQEYTSTSWKAHLADLYAAGTPLTINYELATPIILPAHRKMIAPTYEGGTERVVSDEATTPIIAEVGYPISSKALNEENNVDKQAWSILMADKLGISINKLGTKVFDGTEDWQKVVANEYAIPRTAFDNPNGNYLTTILSGFQMVANNATIGQARWGSSYFNVNYDNGSGGVAAWKAHLSDLHKKGSPLAIFYEKA